MSANGTLSVLGRPDGRELSPVSVPLSLAITKNTWFLHVLFCRINFSRFSRFLSFCPIFSILSIIKVIDSWVKILSTTGITLPQIRNLHCDGLTSIFLALPNITQKPFEAKHYIRDHAKSFFIIHFRRCKPFIRTKSINPMAVIISQLYFGRLVQPNRTLNTFYNVNSCLTKWSKIGEL